MQENLIIEFQNKTDSENEVSENKNKKKQEKEQKQSQNANQISDVPEAEITPLPEEPQEITPLILGRNQNIKDPYVKVIDVSIDSGKICLEGEIINTDSRELKSGKFLFMFDLYDGTSTITCKAFIEKEKFKNISRKNKRCKRC